MSDTTASARPRIAWVDHARGLGILLVVIGHVVSQPTLRHWIFLVHMPFFFMLSGFLAKTGALRSTLERRLLSLAVPYVSFLALVTVLDVALAPLGGPPALFPAWGLLRSLRRVVIGGNVLVLAYGAFWFVPCLIVASTLFALLLRRARGGWRVGAVAIAAAIASYLIPPVKSPQGLFQAPMALFFLWLGWTARERARVGALALAVATSVFVLAGLAAAAFDMKTLHYGRPPANLVAAGAGAVVIAGAAQRLGRVRPIGWALERLGRASLVIMFLHQVLHYHLIGLLPEWGVVVVATIAPALVFLVFDRIVWTRRLFLGEGWNRARPRADPAPAI